jgi:hypothetical protein
VDSTTVQATRRAPSPLDATSTMRAVSIVLLDENVLDAAGPDGCCSHLLSGHRVAQSSGSEQTKAIGAQRTNPRTIRQCTSAAVADVLIASSRHHRCLTAAHRPLSLLDTTPC